MKKLPLPFYKQKNNGFTLIELIIVVAIIGILASIVIFLINPATQFAKARDTQRKSDIANIQTALESYRNDMGTYPSSAINSSGLSDMADSNGAIGCGTNKNLINPSPGNAAIVYLRNIPCDPSTGENYIYSYDGTKFTYSLTTCLEYNADRQKDTSKNPACSASIFTGSYTKTNP